jgi:hypothetical protein
MKLFSRILLTVVVMLSVGLAYAAEEEAPKPSPSSVIQATSVTVKSSRSEGSGTITTREIALEEGSKEKVIVNFVLTAAHVVDDLRSVRTIITQDGKELKVIEFDDASIVREYKQKGRRVGESKMDCKVVCYSDADHKDDLALLMIRQYKFADIDVTTNFKTDNIVEVGTNLLHCGSLLGQMGANSMTAGIMSQQGRVYKNKVYDQTTVSAFPGSSGGGVYVTEDGSPKYVGMITRGAGETFNLMVPMRRMVKWAEKMSVAWIFDPSLDAPSLEEINKLPVEINSGGSIPLNRAEADDKEFIYLDGEHANQCWWSKHYVAPEGWPRPVDVPFEQLK